MTEGMLKESLEFNMVVRGNVKMQRPVVRGENLPKRSSKSFQSQKNTPSASQSVNKRKCNTMLVLYQIYVDRGTYGCTKNRSLLYF